MSTCPVLELTKIKKRYENILFRKIMQVHENSKQKPEQVSQFWEYVA